MSSIHIQRIFLALLIILLRFVLSKPICKISFEVEPYTASFNISFESKVVFSSSHASVVEHGKQMSSKDGTLRFLKEYYSSDIEFRSRTDLHFITSFESIVVFSIIRNSCDNFVFRQFFKDSLQQTSVGDADNISTSFPNFLMPEENDLGYAQWVSWFYSSNKKNRRKALVAPGFDTPLFGLWNQNTTLYGGIGGTGVVCVFNRKGDYAAVLSPFVNPMSISHISPSPGMLSYGIMGNVTSVPLNFTVEIILQMGSSINSVMEKWGDAVRHHYGKKPTSSARNSDITLQYIGYTTDNGAYYYYNTLRNKNYLDTLNQVKEYADSLSIPYRYVLLDSWWYYKGESGGVTNWTARPEVFGVGGLEELYKSTNWLIQAHNRYWDKDSVYATANGGKYRFLIDHIHNGSVPMDEAFWDDLFKNSNKWGLRVYEQDWLFNEFYEYVSQLLESTDLAKTWLKQMAQGADSHGLKIQYCMPYIRHLLQSLEFNAVTQARASDDYVVAPYDGVDNWRIGGQTILLDALGLASSKDGFWTTEYQSGNPYGEERHEPNPRLQSAVASLSGGPIAIGDGIGFTDYDLVLASCRKDGKLLHPSHPARLLDAAFLFRAFSDLNLPDGEVWLASTQLSSKDFGFLFVADLKKSWRLRITDLLITQSITYYVYNRNSNVVSILSPFSSLSISECGLADFTVYTITPQFPNGWGFIGELSKWVGISPIRFIDVSETLNGITVTATGVENEQIVVGFIQPNSTILKVKCVFQFTGNIIITSENVCFNPVK